MADYAPRPYQAQAAAHFDRHPRAALFADVGMGKTVVTATHVRDTLFSCDVRRWLVSAPKQVCRRVWPQEFAKWGHLSGVRVANLEGCQPADRLKPLRDRAVDVCVLNVDLLPWAVENGAAKLFDGVILDESSMFKDGSTVRFKRAQDLTDAASHVKLLTGSPAAQGYAGLWAQAYLLDRGARLGRTYDSFVQTFFTQDYMGYKLELRPGAKERIEQDLADLCLTLRARDHLPVTEPLINMVPIALPPPAFRQYREMEKHCLLPLKEGKVAIAVNAGVLVNKLSQITSGAVYTDPQRKTWETLHTEKLDAIEDIVVEASGAPMLLAYHYTSEADALAKRLGDRIEFYDGTEAQVKRWHANRIPVLAMQPQSAGRGVDGYQGVTTSVLWTSPPWSRELFDQLNGRVLGSRQIGTKVHGVVGVVSVLAAERTIDEVAMKVLQDRGATQDSFLEALKQYAWRSNA